MRRNLRFIALLIRMRLSRMMMFRVGYFGAFFADGMLFIMQLVTFSIIYGQVDHIGDWSRGQMLIFIGTFSMINGLNMMVYFFGVLRIPGLIRTGDLDLYLTKPVSPLMRITFENVDPGSAPLVVLSALIIAYGARVAGIAPSAAMIAAYIALVLIMTLLYYDMELLLRSLTFFFLSAQGIDRLEGEMITLNFQVPGVFFKGFFRILFFYVAPYGIMATAPTQLLSGTLSGAGLAHALAMALLFTLLALGMWRFGRSRYKSASS